MDYSARADKIIDRNFDDQLEFIKRLIRCKSLLLEPGGGEAEAQMTIYRKVKQLGLEADLFNTAAVPFIDKHPGYFANDWRDSDRPQVAGIYRAAAPGGRSLAMCGHVDVVPPGSLRYWDTDPFEPVEKDGRLYGRGSWDMKSGLSVPLYALAALKEAGVGLKGDAYFLSLLEEENGGHSVIAACERGYVGDACLSGDGIEESHVIARGYIGCVCMKAKVFGRTAHMNSPAINAHDKANYLIDRLMELAEEWNAPERRHPDYTIYDHPINFLLSGIEGGTWPSMPIDECTFMMRMSYFPGTSANQAKQEILDYIDKVCAQDPWLKDNPPEVWFPISTFEGALTDPNSEFLKLLGDTYEEHYQRKPRFIVTTGGTDQRAWPLYYGKPSAMVSPSGANLHNYNEYVDIESIRETTKLFAKFIQRWCGVV